MWEENCISGKEGSGTIFFSGCNLGCVYCQNRRISREQKGIPMSVNELSDSMLRLQDMGANNINLVTPTHYADMIVDAVKTAKLNGLKLPVVYNTSGYENVETIEKLNDTVDIYLTDFKYFESETARRYSKAADYPDVAKAALSKMVQQKGKAVFDENGMMQSGVIVRHLLLPGHVNEAKRIVEYLYEEYKEKIFISLMNQFTPGAELLDYPEINRRVTDREYNKLVDYAIEIGIENGFIQEGDTAIESFIPDFDIC